MHFRRPTARTSHTRLCPAIFGFAALAPDNGVVEGSVSRHASREYAKSKLNSRQLGGCDIVPCKMVSKLTLCRKVDTQLTAWIRAFERPNIHQSYYTDDTSTWAISQRKNIQTMVSPTYHPPSMNVPSIKDRFVLDTCSRQTRGMGKVKIIMSVKTFVIPATKYSVARSTHLPGTELSHCDRIGTH